MSRIFDALRQSEKDKRTGPEPWELIPGMPQIPPPEGADAAAPAAQAKTLPPPTPAPGLPELDPAVWMPRQEPLAASAAPVVSEVIQPPAAATPEITVELPAQVEAAPVAEAVEGLQIDWSKLKTVPVASFPSPMLVALSSERSLGAEKFRVLGARLSNIRMAQKLNVLQVTSSVVGEGKTLSSVNLAMTLATRFAQKVLLVEGDLRKPAVCRLLGMQEHPGIGEWWEDEATSVSEYLLHVGETGMCILPAGKVTHPASVLQSARIAELINTMAAHFDWVIIDTPPLLPMADSNLWSRVSDGTLMVVRKGVVSRAALKKAVESLDNPKLVGVVFNDASDYDKVNYYDQYYSKSGLEAARKAAVQ